MPESRDHFLLRVLLFQILRAALGTESTVGSDQFVYWNAADPRRCLAPDVFARLGTPDHSFESWKTWQVGAPQLAVEIVSRSDAGEEAWNEKLARYHELGVDELVRFEPDADQGSRLRVWDRLDGDLVERVVTADRTPSTTLAGVWVVVPTPDLAAALRVATVEGALWPTPEERAARRVLELDAELRRRGA